MRILRSKEFEHLKKLHAYGDVHLALSGELLHTKHSFTNLVCPQFIFDRQVVNLRWIEATITQYATRYTAWRTEGNSISHFIYAFRVRDICVTPVCHRLVCVHLLLTQWDFQLFRTIQLFRYSTYLAWVTLLKRILYNPTDQQVQLSGTSAITWREHIKGQEFSCVDV